MQPTRTDNWPARPTPGEVWWVGHTFYDDTTFNLRAALDDWATRHTARAERVPVDLTTMSQSAPPGDCGRAKTLERNFMETAINIAIWMGVLAFAILLISPPAQATGYGINANPNPTAWLSPNQVYSIDNPYYGVTAEEVEEWCDDYFGQTYTQWGAGYTIGAGSGEIGINASGKLYPNDTSANVWYPTTTYNSTTDQVHENIYLNTGTSKGIAFMFTCYKSPNSYSVYEHVYAIDNTQSVQAAFVVNQSHYRMVPTDTGFMFTGHGNITTYEWHASDSTGRYTWSSEERDPIWQNQLEPGEYYVYLYVNRGQPTEDFADATYTILGGNVTPVPTVLPNTTVNITPAPTVTIQTMATFANLTAYNTTDVRINIEGYFGNLTGPFLDWSDDMAQGITDMADALFYLPNYPVLAITNILTIITDIGQQTLAQMSTSVNLVLQLARIAANSIPSDWQLLMVYALTLETVFLVMRGET